MGYPRSRRGSQRRCPAGPRRKAVQQVPRGMSTVTSRTGMNWSARLLIGLVLLLAGAAAATWALGHYQPAARLLGIVPAETNARIAPQRLAPKPGEAEFLQPKVADKRVSELEARLSRVENATQRAEGSAGRADALVVAFAARRAIDRGVALGYLENLLVDRFGSQHHGAVATIITA